MENYTFAVSENDFLTYFSKDNLMYFIRIKSDIEDVVTQSYEFANPKKRILNAQAEILLKSTYFQYIRQAKDKKLLKFFIDTYLNSNSFKNNSHISVTNFGSTHLRYECEFLIDLLYCISQNSKKINAQISYNSESNTATLQLFTKNSISYGMKFDARIPLENLQSYSANHLGVLMKLKNGEFFTFGTGIDPKHYEYLQNRFALDMKKFLFN